MRVEWDLTDKQLIAIKMHKVWVGHFGRAAADLMLIEATKMDGIVVAGGKNSIHGFYVNGFMFEESEARPD